MGGDIRVVRERVDDTNVRITSLSQEVEALREAMSAMPVMTPTDDRDGRQRRPIRRPRPLPRRRRRRRLARPAAPRRAVGAGRAGCRRQARPPVSTTWPGPTTPPAATTWRSRASPATCARSRAASSPTTRSTTSARATSSAAGCAEAVDAFDRVISTYPQSDVVGHAYYKRGLSYERINQPDRAREDYDFLIKTRRQRRRPARQAAARRAEPGPAAIVPPEPLRHSPAAAGRIRKDDDTMGSVNKVILVGNLGRDAEVRFTPSGAPVASFSIATTENWTSKDGQKQEQTEWHRIVLWGKTAETLQPYLHQGQADLPRGPAADPPVGKGRPEALHHRGEGRQGGAARRRRPRRRSRRPRRRAATTSRWASRRRRSPTTTFRSRAGLTGIQGSGNGVIESTLVAPTSPCLS